MRDYFRYKYVIFDNGQLWCGRTVEERDAIANAWLAANPGRYATGDGNIYFKLDHDLFFGHLWGSQVIMQNLIYSGSANVWHQGTTIPGYLIERDDFIDLDSPRGPEKARFKLVPIGKKS